jgi:hypothetical protein
MLRAILWFSFSVALSVLVLLLAPGCGFESLPTDNLNYDPDAVETTGDVNESVRVECLRNVDCQAPQVCLDGRCQTPDQFVGDIPSTPAPLAFPAWTAKARVAPLWSRNRGLAEIWDPTRRELIQFGRRDSPDDMRLYAVAENQLAETRVFRDGVWRVTPDIARFEPGRGRFAALHIDPKDGLSAFTDAAPFGETATVESGQMAWLRWRFDGQRWQRGPVLPGPAAQSVEWIFVDPPTGELVAAIGDGVGVALWRFAAGAWTPFSGPCSANVGPSAEAMLVHDPASKDTLLLCTGDGRTYRRFDNTWTEVSGLPEGFGGPGARARFVATFKGRAVALALDANGYKPETGSRSPSMLHTWTGSGWSSSPLTPPLSARNPRVYVTDDGLLVAGQLATTAEWTSDLDASAVAAVGNDGAWQLRSQGALGWLDRTGDSRVADRPATPVVFDETRRELLLIEPGQRVLGGDAAGAPVWTFREGATYAWNDDARTFLRITEPTPPPVGDCAQARWSKPLGGVVLVCRATGDTLAEGATAQPSDPTYAPSTGAPATWLRTASGWSQVAVATPEFVTDLVIDPADGTPVALTRVPAGATETGGAIDGSLWRLTQSAWTRLPNPLPVSATDAVSLYVEPVTRRITAEIGSGAVRLRYLLNDGAWTSQAIVADAQGVTLSVPALTGARGLSASLFVGLDGFSLVWRVGNATRPLTDDPRLYMVSPQPPTLIANPAAQSLDVVGPRGLFRVALPASVPLP